MTTGPLSRDSVPELANHFSVSLDYGPDSPLNTDHISFNNLKERVEIIISNEGQSGGQGQSDPSNDLVFDPRSGSDGNPEVSFEAMVGQFSRDVSHVMYPGDNITCTFIEVLAACPSMRYSTCVML